MRAFFVFVPYPTMTPPLDRRFAYGLRFQSQFALPDLPAFDASGGADVSIEVGRTLPLAEVEARNAPDAPIENVLSFSENSSSLLFAQVGRFEIEGDARVLVEPLEGTSASTWRVPLLGSVLALLLEARGWLALHAGAVEMTDADGQPVACAFAADKGQGKSTLGAAFSLAGYPLFCDDVLALDFASDAPLGAPLARVGFGSMKLVPDAVRAVVGAAPDTLPRVAPELDGMGLVDKQYFMAPLASAARPLRHVFLLASHDDPARPDIDARALSPGEALGQLLPHTFAARWSDLYLTGARRVAHFRACAALAAHCHVWELSRRRDLALLPQTIETVTRLVRETRG